MKPWPSGASADRLLASGFVNEGEDRLRADGCRVTFTQGWAAWEVEIGLPGGARLTFDVPLLAVTMHDRKSGA